MLLTPPLNEERCRARRDGEAKSLRRGGARRRLGKSSLSRTRGQRALIRGRSRQIGKQALDEKRGRGQGEGRVGGEEDPRPEEGRARFRILSAGKMRKEVGRRAKKWG